MDTTQMQHEIIWTNEKSTNFWAYVSRNSGQEEIYFGKHAGRSVVEIVKRYISLRGRIIDYGCGPGMFMEHLFAQGIACIGLDFSKESLDVLETKHDRNPLFGGAIHVTGLPTPVKTGSADVVFFLETIEHLLPEHFQPTLVEIARIVRPSGYVVVTTPHNEDLSKDMVYCPDCGGVFHRWQHVSSFTVESLTQLMSSHGFRKVICKPTLFCEYSTPVRSLLIAAQKILGKPLPNLLYIGTKIDS